MATAKKRDYLWFIKAVIRNVCCRCGKHFNGDGVECEPCRRIRAVEERNARAAERRYWKKHFARESSKA
mgnify:CR=1 FL=1